ncbi:MAG: signal peptidase I [Erysipelotrichales bacterium]|nr:signal peptidase I [Erysipelotrichales bacterium]
MNENENNTVEVKTDTVDENIQVNENTNELNEIIDRNTTSNVFGDLSPNDFDKLIAECEVKNRRKKNKRMKSDTNIFITILTIARDLLCCYFVAALITTFLFRPIRIDGKSMYPTLHDGDLAFSGVIGLNVDDIDRFDIVVIYDEVKEEYLVKRIVGMPNEMIQYVEDTLFIDGVKISEDFLDDEYRLSVSMAINDYFTDDFKPFMIGEGEYFVVGDNRPSSRDSRDFGVINESQIVSKGVFVIYPINRLGVK